MYDSWGDGICCGYGIGDFMVLNSSGQTIVYNNGDFGSEAIEAFVRTVQVVILQQMLTSLIQVHQTPMME